MLVTPKPKPTGPCPSCGLRVVLTGAGRHPCSWCGAPLTAAVADA